MADPSEQLISVLFPLAGLDVSCEFGRQTAQTTPAGANVRAYEVITERARGGSRCGLSQYIPAQVNGLDSPVQYLCILVDPQDPGLNAPTDGPVPDPSTNNLSVRNPGRFFPVGGSGTVPNRNKGSTADQLRQSVSNDFFGGNTSDISLTFGSQPLSGSLLLVIVSYAANQSQAPPHGADGAASNVTGLTNGAAVPYTRIGGPGYSANNSITYPGGSDPDTTQEWAVSMWYVYSTGSADDTTAKVGSPNNESSVAVGDIISLVALEYTGFASAPTAFAKSQSSGNVSPASGGVLSLSNVTGAIVISAIAGAIDPNGVSELGLTAAPGFRTRSQNVITSGGGNGAGIVMDKIVKATTITPTATPNTAGTTTGISTTFNPA